MNARAILLAVLAASALLVGAAGAVTAQPNDADDQGPPGDLPGPVPDFVEDILGAVGDFLSGGVSALGDVVSGIAAGK